MIVDPKTYSDSVNKNLHTEPPKTILDYSVNNKDAASVFGAAFETYEKAGVSEKGSVDMSDATYCKPGKEKDAVEHLENDAKKDELTRRNEMIVLSQTTTPEEAQRLQEEGFSITESDCHTIVTVTDKIKAVLLANGDTSMGELSQEQLEEITGSVAMARKIERITDETKAYLLKNNLEPTIENVYKAVYSGQHMQQNPISDTDFGAMREQIEGLLEKSGISVDNYALEQSRWLISYGIPVTEENLEYLGALNQYDEALQQGIITESDMEERVISSVQNGVLPKDTMMIDGYSREDYAKQVYDTFLYATEEEVSYCVAEGKEITAENLRAARRQNGQSDSRSIADEAKLATARRQLEEIRLAMTVDANKSLLKRGIQIDTKPIEELLTELKNLEDSYYSELLASEGVEASDQNVEIFRNTEVFLEDLKGFPAYFIEGLSKEDTLEVFHTKGLAQKESFDSAVKRYETLMTSPRKDLGDDIGKAFQNVDDILEDLGLEKTKGNQRAVRILAYNQTAITKENVERVKCLDEEVSRAFRNMTPKVTLEMIRKGENPLQMSVEELNHTAQEIKDELGYDDVERYGRFIYKLEQNHTISQEERQSFIGIYRLMAQVEKSDGAVIGVLMNQGAEITMKNLLSATRTGRKFSMEYSVDDNFEGISVTEKGARIDDQIMTAFHTQCISDALEVISPEKIQNLGMESVYEMTPEQLKEAMESIEHSETEVGDQEQYLKEELSGFGKALENAEDIYDYLGKFDAPTSVNNVLAAVRMLQNGNTMFEQLFGRTETKKDRVEQMKAEVFSRFGEAIKTPEALAKAQEELAEAAENAMKNMILEEDVSTLDLREYRLMTASLQLCARQAREESYMVPVETADGICGVAVRVIRDKDRKGTVDISFNGNLAGRVAASFEAKEDHLSGVIAVSDENTRQLLSDNLGLLASYLNTAPGEGETEPVDLRVALIPDLSLEKFRLHSASKNNMNGTKNEVQTQRLYGIAEGFIRTIQECMGESPF